MGSYLSLLNCFLTSRVRESVRREFSKFKCYLVVLPTLVKSIIASNSSVKVGRFFVSHLKESEWWPK